MRCFQTHAVYPIGTVTAWPGQQLRRLLRDKASSHLVERTAAAFADGDADTRHRKFIPAEVEGFCMFLGAGVIS